MCHFPFGNQPDLHRRIMEDNRPTCEFKPLEGHQSEKRPSESPPVEQFDPDQGYGHWLK